MQRNILPLKPTQPGHADVVNTLKHETHIEVQLGDILPALTDALLSQRLWIRDFSEDKISITNFNLRPESKSKLASKSSIISLREAPFSIYKISFSLNDSFVFPHLN